MSMTMLAIALRRSIEHQSIRSEDLVQVPCFVLLSARSKYMYDTL